MGDREILAAVGRRARILVVDDSAIVRRLVTTALEREPDFHVVGTAANGRIALAKIEQLDPDLVTLDLEMPEMNGLETLKAMRAKRHRARVIVFSTLTERGGKATLDALSLGADDYATKTPGAGSVEELVPKIRHLLLRQKLISLPRSLPPRIPRELTRRALVIGVSTGGPAALTGIVPEFPADFPAPVLIVQHMPAMFTRLLADRLQTRARLPVSEAREGDPVLPGRILIAPGDKHLRVKAHGNKVVVTLDQGPPENSCRPAVDVLFRSAAEVWGGGVVAAILTGMGRDGLEGTRVLAALGAYVVAQDEASSVVWGMPGAVVAAGLAHAVTGLSGMIAEICKHFRGAERR